MINRLPDAFLAEARPRAPQPEAAPLDVNREVQRLYDRVEHLVREYPAACLTGAFFIGATLAWWMKRR